MHVLLWRVWQSAWAFIVDTMPLVVFSVPAALPTVCYECIFSGLTFERAGMIRIVYGLIRIIGARYCNQWVDWVRMRPVFATRHYLWGIFADAVALALYQCPVYAGVAWILGALPGQIMSVCAISLIGDFSFSWVYRLLRERTRRCPSAVRGP